MLARLALLWYTLQVSIRATAEQQQFSVARNTAKNCEILCDRLRGQKARKRRNDAVLTLIYIQTFNQGVPRSSRGWITIFISFTNAGVAELADALDLGSSGFPVQVQLLSPAPIQILTLNILLRVFCLYLLL